jgi:hypothetical protein
MPIRLRDRLPREFRPTLSVMRPGALISRYGLGGILPWFGEAKSFAVGHRHIGMGGAR